MPLVGEVMSAAERAQRGWDRERPSAPRGRWCDALAVWAGWSPGPQRCHDLGRAGCAFPGRLRASGTK